MAATTRVDAPRTVAAPRAVAAPGDYVVYGSVPWGGSWLTEHNLAHALAARRRVLFVEPPITPLTPLRGADRWSAPLARHTRREGRLLVFRPVALPPLEHRRARTASAPLVRAQVRRAVARAGMRSPLAVAARAMPEVVGGAGERAVAYLVKDWVQSGSDLLGRAADELDAEVAAMCARSDLVCATSPQLCRTLGDRGVEAALLRHGFHGDLASRYDTAPAPSEYDGLPRPILGFAGTIDGRLDFDALHAVAEAFRHGSLVLIGPVSRRLDHDVPARLSARPNVHLLGACARERLPRLLVHLDCALLPYRPGEWARHGAPLKLWDHLYAGPPLVGSGYEILRDFAPHVRYAHAPGDLPEAIRAALAEPGAGRDERRALAMANTWDHRARALERLLRDRADEKSAKEVRGLPRYVAG